jgi:hypothetical protein
LAPANPAHVVTVTPNPTLVTDTNVTTPPTPTFAVRITYDDAMNMSTTPTVIFSPNVSDTLTPDPTWSFWINSTSYYAGFDVADAGMIVPSIGIVVLGAKDDAGDPQAAYVGAAGFTIDTTIYAPVATVAPFGTPTVTDVTQTNEGGPTAPATNAGFVLRIDYDHPMNMNSRPTVTFTSATDLSGTLIPDSNWSFWINSTTYYAGFDVAVVGTGVTASDLHVHVIGAYDAIGNIQAEYTNDAPFTIDTTTTLQLATVVNVTSNLTMVTSANVGLYTFYVDVFYNEPMRMIGSPTITFSPDVSSTLQPNADYTGWINSQDFRAGYNVLPTSDVFPTITITVAGAHDLETYTIGNDVVVAVGNIQQSYNGSAPFTINML